MFDDRDPSEPKRPPTFAILGAGLSGMCMAIRLRQAGIDTFTIYEKAGDVGGTWRENAYPGVACDVPSHLYSFSFEPNPNWSQRYSPGDEIWEYTKHCARKYDLYRSIQFGKKVVDIAHDGKQWRVDFEDGASIKADYVISGLGGLHVPNMPVIEGSELFNGPVFHTAEWRGDVDLTGKRVAVIGSAASAVQVVPQIVDKVAHLDLYQRTPNWIIARRSYAYPEWLKKTFAKVPLLARAYRGFYFTLAEWRFGAFKKDDSRTKRAVSGMFTRHMEAQVKDPALRARLTPDYPIGCKRILISDDYLPAVQRENVDLVTDPITAITAAGVSTKDGKHRDVDVIIMATGFKPFDILASIDVAGPSGETLRDHWRDGVTAHRSLSIAGFPNFFMLLGPNSGLGHNSVILMIEAQVNYIIKLISEAMAAGETMIAPKPAAAKAYDARIQADLQDRVWAAHCGAWYVDEHGRNYTLYPHDVRTYLKEMAAPDMSEYDLTPKSALEPAPAPAE